MSSRMRGPVIDRAGRSTATIERASEPALPRGLIGLLVFAAIGGAAYVSGALQPAERAWNDVTIAARDLLDSSRTPRVAAPAPTPDPMREGFNQSVLSQLRPPERQPVSREAPTPSVPPVPAPPSAPSEPSRPPVVASAPPAPPQPATPMSSGALDPDIVFPRPPGAEPAQPFSPEALNRMVQMELAAFNASREVPAKRAAMQRIVAAAQLGHGPARGLIARSYPGSTIVRDVAPAADAVRFALDFIIYKKAFSNDAQKDFVALAAWFDKEKRDAAFAKAIFDAVRDDSRLQASDKMNDLMRVLFQAERGCAALRRQLDIFNTTTTTAGHCGLDLAQATPEMARQQGVAGLEEQGFREATETLRNVVSQ